VTVQPEHEQPAHDHAAHDDPAHDEPEQADATVPELIQSGEASIDLPEGDGFALPGLDLGGLLAAASQAAEQLAAAQESLLSARVQGSAGGGVVRVVVNGHLHLLEVAIDPEAVDPDDPSMIGDLVVAAFADAQQQVAELQRQQDPMSGLGGLGDLGGLLGGG
jgi:DNA-binding YbaB/EbfC family protein